MGIPIPGKDCLYIETGPWSSSYTDLNLVITAPAIALAPSCAGPCALLTTKKKKKIVFWHQSMVFKWLARSYKIWQHFNGWESCTNRWLSARWQYLQCVSHDDTAVKIMTKTFLGQVIADKKDNNSIWLKETWLCKYEHIEGSTKWLPFCRQHFQMHFHEGNLIFWLKFHWSFWWTNVDQDLWRLLGILPPTKASFIDFAGTNLLLF